MKASETKSAIETLDLISIYLVDQRELACKSGSLSNWERDCDFVQKSREVIERGNPSEVQAYLANDFRGLSHWFASYIKESDPLNTYLDLLYSDLVSLSECDEVIDEYQTDLPF